jgi:hypothetical protein
MKQILRSIIFHSKLKDVNLINLNTFAVKTIGIRLNLTWQCVASQGINKFGYSQNQNQFFVFINWPRSSVRFSCPFYSIIYDKIFFIREY